MSPYKSIKQKTREIVLTLKTGNIQQIKAAKKELGRLFHECGKHR